MKEIQCPYCKENIKPVFFYWKGIFICPNCKLEIDYNKKLLALLKIIFAIVLYAMCLFFVKLYDSIPIFNNIYYNNSNLFFICSLTGQVIMVLILFGFVKFLNNRSRNIKNMKIPIVLSSLAAAVFILISIIFFVHTQSLRLDLNQLGGTLLINIKSDVKDDNSAKILSYNLKNNQLNNYGGFGRNPVFSPDLKKVYSIYNNTIVGYDIETKNKEIFEINYKNIREGKIENLRFVGSRNRLSFVDSFFKRMYILDIDTKEISPLVEVVLKESNQDYSWSKDGRYLYYSPAINSEDDVVKYDTKTGERTNINEYRSVKLSTDGKYIAYVNWNNISVKNIETNEKWGYDEKEGYIWDYKFSPDNRFLALFVYDSSKDKRLLKIIDYRTGKRIALINKLCKGYSSFIDWR